MNIVTVVIKTVIVVALMQSSLVLASDIAHEVRNSGSSVGISSYFELGAEAYIFTEYKAPEDPGDELNSDAGASVFIGGAYYKRGFFLEAAYGTFDGINLGYNLWRSDDWSVDLLAASVRGGLTADNDIEITDSDKVRDRKLLDRDSIYSGAGVRVTGYLGDYIMQYRLVSDTHGGNGITSSVRLGRHWQYRNWNFHGIAGVEYSSADTNNYLWGVTAAEATQRFSEYQAGASISPHAELGLAYPMSENWVFRSFARYQYLPSEVQDSPLVEKDYVATLSASVIYVF